MKMRLGQPGRRRHRVTETFDWAPACSPGVLEQLGIAARNARSIDATLERLVQRFA